MDIEERYQWILRLSVNNGLHPYSVLREAVRNDCITQSEAQEIRRMLVSRSHEHTFDVKSDCV